MDCYGFFAPGQLGVAIGRAVSTDHLRVRNYSSDYAKIKYLPHVYDFYTQCNDEDVLLDDLSSCRPTIHEVIDIQEKTTPTAIEFLENLWSAADTLNKATSVDELPRSSAEVTFDLCDYQPPAEVTVKQEILVRFVSIIHTTLNLLLPGNGQSKDTWASAFRKFHQYLLSVEYKQHLCLLFQTPFVSPVCKRYATKLVFTIHHAIVVARAKTIRKTKRIKVNVRILTVYHN